MSESIYIYNGIKYTEDEMLRLLSHSKNATRSDKCLKLTEGDLILDVGCGIGYFT